MYWNGHFNLYDLCDQFPLDTYDRNNVTREILLLFKKYLSNSEKPEDLFNKLRLSQGSIGVCRIIWPNETVLFKCNDCQYDDTCAICINCFLTSSHNGHSWSMSKSYGGCCDCGDISSWKRSGSCYKHQGISARQDGPRSLVPFSCKFYKRSLNLVSDIVSFIDNHILNSSSSEHKFSSILLDILKELANLLHGLRWIINDSIRCKVLSRWIKRHKDLDLCLQKSFGLFYLAMFASPKFKIKFSRIFARNYFAIITPFPKLLYDNTIFNMAELSVQLLTVPEIAISFARSGFIHTCLKHLKKLFKTLSISPITHGEFIAKGFLHECTHICTDLSFLLNHKDVSKFVIEDVELHCELFDMLLNYTYVNPQVLHIDQHIEMQNTLYPLTFIIEDGIIFALRPLWLNLNKYKEEFTEDTILTIYSNYLKSIITSIKLANSLQSDSSTDVVYLCRTFHIPLLRLMPNIIHLQTIKTLMKGRVDVEINELVNKSMTHVMDQCLKCHLFYLEIKGGIWVRNGDSMLGQNEKYKSMGFLDRDVASMQMASLVMNLLPEESRKNNFLQILIMNCFPYIGNIENFFGFISKSGPRVEFKTPFEAHYYKFIDYSIKCFSIILCRYVSNVAQLIASNWDLNAPLTDTDGDNFVKYFLFKMDIIHYIQFDSTKVAELVRYAERKWPNGNLFKLLEQIGNLKRYGNGEANVTLKPEYLSFVDLYWPGDFSIVDENLINKVNPNVNIKFFPETYLILHGEVIYSVYGLLLELLQSFNAPTSVFKLPSRQFRIIVKQLLKFDPGNTTLVALANGFTDLKTLENSVVNPPKRSSQIEALLNLKKKQLNFMATLDGYDDIEVEDDKSVYCILCHSSGELNLLCYQMPLAQACKRPTLNNFYPLYKCIETCGHVIHQHCLETYVSNKRYSFKKSFPCPLCKLQVNLTIPFIHDSSDLNNDEELDSNPPSNNNLDSLNASSLSLEASLNASNEKAINENFFNERNLSGAATNERKASNIAFNEKEKATNVEKEKPTIPVIQLNDAFIATYWELLITTSFKRNLLISNHATMLTQLMKHQYRGSIISINYENYDVESDLWSLNPVADLLKFIFTGSPTKNSIINHVCKLTYIVIIQLLLDDYISKTRDKSGAGGVETPLSGSQHFRLTKSYKFSFSFQAINEKAINERKRKMDERGKVGIRCSRTGSIRVKIPIYGRAIGYSRGHKANTGDSSEGGFNLRLFLPVLHDLLELLGRSDFDILLVVSYLSVRYGDRMLSKLSDFISLCLWSIHCVFPYKNQITKKFAHEHLITNQLERFNLLWNLVSDSPRVTEFVDIIKRVVTNCGFNYSGDFDDMATLDRINRPRFSLKMFRLAKRPDVIPRDYMKLLRNTMAIKCIICRNKPLSPVVCLFCCKWICLYCKDGDRHMGSFEHAAKCSFGCGCLFLVHQRKVLYICSYTKRYAYVDSIYNGPFGTFRENLTSNSPLQLSRSRLITIANDLFFNRRSIKWQQIRLNLVDDEGDPLNL